MDLNYSAVFLLPLLPMIMAIIWYHPDSSISKLTGISIDFTKHLNIPKLVIAYLLCFFLVYGYMNLVIHQLGFYELFFTDIMKGSSEAKEIVVDFLRKYGQKHRHFGHGALHGVLNAFMIVLPFVVFHAFVDQKDRKYVACHFSFWLVTSILLSGMIAAFV